MISHIYGTFSSEQFNDYKKQLHNKLFWLLLYQDPNTKEDYPLVNIQEYFTSLLLELDGLNQLLSCPKELVSIMSILEEAKSQCMSEEFNFKVYRKLILDAHQLVDTILESEV